MLSTHFRKGIQSGFLALLFGTAMLQAEVLQIRHDHDPWGKCIGELEIRDAGIEFRSKKEEHSRHWDWLEIQSFDRKSDQKFAILTWEDEKMKLGLDRYFHLTVLPEEAPLSPEAFALIWQNLEGTITDRMTEEEFSPDYSLRVKHLHPFGGCEGTLNFGPEWIVYQTDHKKHSRTWKRDREVESVWSLHRYQFEVHVFEENQRNFDKTRRFRFHLKQPLDEAYYQQLRREFLPAR